jgi:hypothetical protein
MFPFGQCRLSRKSRPDYWRLTLSSPEYARGTTVKIPTRTARCVGPGCALSGGWTNARALHNVSACVQAARAHAQCRTTQTPRTDNKASTHWQRARIQASPPGRPCRPGAAYRPGGPRWVRVPLRRGQGCLRWPGAGEGAKRKRRAIAVRAQRSYLFVCLSRGRDYFAARWRPGCSCTPCEGETGQAYSGGAGTGRPPSATDTS